MKTYIMNSKPAQIIIGLLLTLVLLWGYGYTKAASQHANGSLSVISGVVTIMSLNPISAAGYKTYIQSIMVDVAEVVSKREKAEEVKKLKAQYTATVQSIAESCIERIEQDLKSGSVFVKNPVGEGNKVHFTLNMYKLKKIMDFTCGFQENTITSIDGTTVRKY